MARRFNNADPTADAAIRRADRARARESRVKPSVTREKRFVVDEFAAEFAGLMDHEIRRVAVRALALADNDPWKIDAEHIVTARKAVMGR